MDSNSTSPIRITQTRTHSVSNSDLLQRSTFTAYVSNRLNLALGHFQSMTKTTQPRASLPHRSPVGWQPAHCGCASPPPTPHWPPCFPNSTTAPTAPTSSSPVLPHKPPSSHPAPMPLGRTLGNSSPFLPRTSPLSDHLPFPPAEEEEEEEDSGGRVTIELELLEDRDKRRRRLWLPTPHSPPPVSATLPLAFSPKHTDNSTTLT